LGEEIAVLDAFKAADDVLKNAVGGIAEIINVEGLVNVDFEDVRTVMGEVGKAMMGSAVASGVDRARIAAEQAVASPLLDGVELSGARGVLVNISGSRQLSMKEVKEVMNTIRSYAADDAHIIYGTVFDEAMEDQLRVTVVATGLGGAVAKRQPTLRTVEGVGLRTGTDNGIVDVIGGSSEAALPQVFHGRARNAAVQADDGQRDVDKYDIPAFCASRQTEAGN
jgi:cell division protein FtsZ